MKLAYRSKVSALTGGPGVGKTTAIRALLDALDAQGVSYALAAPTGRAARRMTEATGRPASTLHRLLEFQPGIYDFAYNEKRPLPQRFMIVDEVSMLDILLAYRLVRAIAAEASLLLVGDADQLPSVGPGAVLADILASERIPHARLTELFRQARESAIIVTAHGVNAGEMPHCARSRRATSSSCAPRRPTRRSGWWWIWWGGGCPRATGSTRSATSRRSRRCIAGRRA